MLTANHTNLRKEKTSLRDVGVACVLAGCITKHCYCLQHVGSSSRSSCMHVLRHAALCFNRVLAAAQKILHFPIIARCPCPTYVHGEVVSHLACQLGLWCNGITPVQHTGGPRLKLQPSNAVAWCKLPKAESAPEIIQIDLSGNMSLGFSV